MAAPDAPPALRTTVTMHRSPSPHGHGTGASGRRSHAGIVMVLVLVLAVVASTGARAATSQQTRVEGYVGDGLYLRERAHPGPVTSVEVHVQPGADVDFVPVLAHASVGSGREVVSAMCNRVGGVVCVNANFAQCSRCAQPLGGIVQDGVVVRSPTAVQDQVSVVDGRLSLTPWRWSARLTGDRADEPVDIDGLNTIAGPDGIVAYTSRYGSSTGAPPGSYELVVGSTGPLVTGTEIRRRVELWRTHTGGDAPIPEGGLVLSGRGRGADALWAFVEANRGGPVDLVTTTPDGLEQSFAGHPVLLRDGQRVAHDRSDGKVRNRHPRTVIGWDDLGSTWVVVVDGRQRQSRGMTLDEVTDHLVALGARHGVNLDGGGSSTMVTHCPSRSGWCLRNRPSDGGERPVPVALAIRPRTPQPPPATAQQEPPPAATSDPARPAPADPAETDLAAAAAAAPPPPQVIEVDAAGPAPAVADPADTPGQHAVDAAPPASAPTTLPATGTDPEGSVDPAAAPVTSPSEVLAAGRSTVRAPSPSTTAPALPAAAAAAAGALVAFDALALVVLLMTRHRPSATE